MRNALPQLPRCIFGVSWNRPFLQVLACQRGRKFSLIHLVQGDLRMFSLDLPHRYTPRKAPGVFCCCPNSLSTSYWGKYENFLLFWTFQKRTRNFVIYGYSKTHGEAFNPI